MENNCYAIEIDNLVKTYGNVVAVNNISFKVAKGSLFAFLGINGAGKSTTINIICSILNKDSGNIFINGHNLDNDGYAIKNEIGIVFQSSVLDKELTVKQNLDIRTSFYSLSKQEKKENIQTIIDLLDLGPILNRPVKNLSGGQMRRVDIARAMVHRPKLLILDEPTTGLDPKTRLSVWALIDKIRTETGMTVFLTTHYLEEAEKATDVVIMDKGRIIAHGTPNYLKNKYSNDVLVSYMAQNEEFEKLLNKNNERYTYDTESQAYRIILSDKNSAKRILKDYDAYTADVEILKGKMDDVFLNITGKDIKIAGEDNDGTEG